MLKILSGLKALFLVLVLQCLLVPCGIGDSPVSATSAWADEAQEMVDSAPPILQAAYEGNWKKVIAIAKKDPRTLKDTDDMGTTAFIVAARWASDSVVMELLKLGADKNAKDFTSQQTRPYDYARRNKKLSAKVRNMLR
jgi:hypothetical protein